MVARALRQHVAFGARAVLLVFAVYYIAQTYGERRLEWNLQHSLETVDAALHGPMPAADGWLDLSDILHANGVTAPVDVALPPQYNEWVRGNPGYMQGMTRYRSILVEWGPFPFPKFSIKSNYPPYNRDNRAANAALVGPCDGRGNFWPVGYSAWIELLTDPIDWTIDTPALLTSDGRRLAPTSATVLSPQNTVVLGAENTRFQMRRWEPVVFEFSEAGKLPPDHWRYAIEPDGRHVSYLVEIPHPSDKLLGLFLLQDLVPQRPVDPPRWWEIDRRLRAAVVRGEGPSVAEPLFDELERLYPGHPLLEHYRVIASFRGPRFNERWLARQRKVCDLPLWHLLPYVDVSWNDARELHCWHDQWAASVLKDQIHGAILMKFWSDRHQAGLEQITSELLAKSYLNRTDRTFVYPYSDLAYLWRQPPAEAGK